MLSSYDQEFGLHPVYIPSIDVNLAAPKYPDKFSAVNGGVGILSLSQNPDSFFIWTIRKNSILVLSKIEDSDLNPLAYVDII